MTKKIRIYLITGFLVFYYMVCLFAFLIPKDSSYAVLKDRFGTILWHSSDKWGQESVYCYYPKNNAQFDRGGERILIKVKSFTDCHNFFGTVIIHEPFWMSEKDKLKTVI